MGIITVSYSVPGKTEATSLPIQQGINADEFITDVLGLALAKHDISINGEMMSAGELGRYELEDGDVITVTMIKTTSGR
jgi:hypothetical protein